MPTSPVPSNPDTWVIEETINSVRERLPDCEIIVMMDGCRVEQYERKPAYAAYKRRLLWRINHEMHNVLPIVFNEHLHQGNITREALRYVRTPLVLFVEHDTPLVGAFDWPALVRAALSDKVNLIRFHHEAQILDVHRHLMLDDDPQYIEDCPLMRTYQWSQRPHLAKTRFYRMIIDTYFGQNSRTMIEDVMHGALDYAGRNEQWDDFKVWMYTPPGVIKRSEHLDGRGGDEKFEMYYDYDYDTPPGAPAPTASRVMEQSVQGSVGL